MANRSKIIGEIETIVKKLILEGYNATYIGKQIGVSKDTIKKWAQENGLELVQRTTPDKQVKIDKFIELVKAGKTAKEAKAESGIKGGIGKDFIEKYGLRDYIRTHSEAALDKILSFEEATKRLPEKSGKVVGYDQSQNKYRVIALDGYIYYKKSSKLYQGDPRGKSGTFSDISKLKEDLLEIGYEYIEGTFNKKRKAIKAKHLKCDTIRENRFRNFFVQDCPTCINKGVSKQEISLKEWIESLGFKVEKYKFKERITRPKEIDIDILDTPFSIEYCGVYDHCENSREPRDKWYHYEKMEKERQRNKQLITIWDYEFKNRNYQVKGFLKSLLNKNERTLYARDCTIKEIDGDYANEFLDVNHIQGRTRGIFYTGLFFGKELVGVMSFAYDTRNTKANWLVISRMCFKADTSIIGGASKLLENSKDKVKSLGYSTIITHSDNRWSTGNVYEKMGFVLNKVLNPDYKYFKSGNIYSKSSLRKTEEEKLDERSELELRKSQGYDWFWDCGKKTWKLELI